MSSPKKASISGPRRGGFRRPSNSSAHWQERKGKTGLVMLLVGAECVTKFSECRSECLPNALQYHFFQVISSASSNE
nr:uncharacterized protein LOC125421745 isoform X2 [Ziziphus jujuba var. spinosa]